MKMSNIILNKLIKNFVEEALLKSPFGEEIKKSIERKKRDITICSKCSEECTTFTYKVGDFVKCKELDHPYSKGITPGEIYKIEDMDYCTFYTTNDYGKDTNYLWSYVEPCIPTQEELENFKNRYSDL